MKCLILCGGLGTRLGLKNKPKCMAMVAGKPVLEHIVDLLNSHGVTEIVVNLHVKPETVIKYFGPKLHYSYEDKPLGRELTIARLSDWLGSEYLVINGDTISNVDLGFMIDIGHCRYVGSGGVFAGYEVIDTKLDRQDQARVYMPGCWWIDIGSPAGLERARRKLLNGHD